MSEITFNVGGRIMSEGQVRAIEGAKRPVKPKASAGPGSYHKGWAVEGFHQSTLDAAKEAADQAIAEWDRATDEERARRLRSGERAPELWSEGRYVTTHKAKRVRARPLEIPSAAEQMKALAEKSGWLYVKVVELKKGDPASGGF
jgi:hypothetical protein